MNGVDSTETYISLYSGGAGLDMGFKRVKPDAECVAFVEHEASAAALLVDHVEAELVDAAPVFTDAFTFPAGKFRGLVDWIIGGPPCQPFSVAGKRLGADDARNLWPLTLRMVAEIQPRGCFFENVPSADSLWYVYEEVIPGLQHLGYEVEAGIFSAAEVGAPHNRERIFILAYARDNRTRANDKRQGFRNTEQDSRELADTGRELEHVQQRRAGPELARVGSNVGYAGYSTRSTEQRQQPQGPGGRVGEPGKGTVATPRQLSGQVPQAGEPDGAQRDAATRASGELGDTDQPRLQGRQQPIGERGDERPAWPPGPTGDWSSVPERLWPAVKPGFRDPLDELAGRVAALSRSQELRILGNGVVPATAARAFSTLMESLRD